MNLNEYFSYKTSFLKQSMNLENDFNHQLKKDLLKELMNKKVVILAVTVLIFSSNFQAVSAEIFFPSTNIRLTNPPTYCIIAPTDEISKDKSPGWVKMTEKGISYWEQRLKELEHENDNIWELEAKVISEGNNDKCDVSIEFKNKPSLSDTIGGFFSWPTGKIVIYYLQPKLCNNVIPCYDEKTFKSDNTIYAITIHEIGHSLGLDHYVSDNNDLNRKWQSGNQSPPSVMIPTIPNRSSLLQITDIDIQKVREIYGAKGFYAFSNSIIPTTNQISVPDPIIPSSPITSLNISQKIIEVNGYDREIITLSGKISEEEFHRGISVIITIHKPDNSVEVLRISTAGNGYFETLLIFNDESIRGSYRVSASYTEQVDKNMDIIFEVIDKKTNSSTSKLKPNTRILDNDQSENSVSQNNEQIPGWIKNNAEWWADEQIGDHAFVSSIQYLINHNIIQIPEIHEANSQNFKEMPIWVKNIAGFWATDNISDDEFIRSIEFLLESEIIIIP